MLIIGYHTDNEMQREIYVLKIGKLTINKKASIR